MNSTTASDNTFFGYEAGYSNITGAFNTFFGFQAGYYPTGNSNIYIGNMGPPSGPEYHTIRIGNQGSGNKQQNATFIAGIAGMTVSGVAVYVELRPDSSESPARPAALKSRLATWATAPAR